MDFRTGWAAFGKASMMALAITVLALLTFGANAGMNEDLFKASERGDLPEVKRLLDKGADVNAKVEGGGIGDIPKYGGNTALMGASFGGHLEVVEALLAGGADVNAKNDLGMTALILASGFCSRTKEASFIEARQQTPEQ